MITEIHIFDQQYYLSLSLLLLGGLLLFATAVGSITHEKFKYMHLALLIISLILIIIALLDICLKRSYKDSGDSINEWFYSYRLFERIIYNLNTNKIYSKTEFYDDFIKSFYILCLRNNYMITTIFEDENLSKILTIDSNDYSTRDSAIINAYLKLINQKIIFETSRIDSDEGKLIDMLTEIILGKINLVTWFNICTFFWYPREKLVDNVVKNYVINWCKQNNRKYGTTDMILHMSLFTPNPKEGQSVWDNIDELTRNDEYNASVNTINIIKKMGLFSKIFDIDFTSRVINEIKLMLTDENNLESFCDNNKKLFLCNLYKLQDTFRVIQDFNTKESYKI